MFPPVTVSSDHQNENDDTVAVITGLIFDNTECIDIFKFKGDQEAATGDHDHDYPQGSQRINQTMKRKCE